MSQQPSKQMELDYTPGLTRQYPTWLSCISAMVHQAPGGVVRAASILNRGHGRLSRQLSEPDETDQPLHLPPSDVVRLMEEYHDYRPIYWLIEKFLDRKADPKAETARQLIAMRRTLDDLTRQMGLDA